MAEAAAGKVDEAVSGLTVMKMVKFDRAVTVDLVDKVGRVTSETDVVMLETTVESGIRVIKL